MNGQIDELVNISKRLKTSDINNANVIIDFADKKVEKCVIEGKEVDMDFEKARNYYHSFYPQMIQQLETEAPVVKEKEKSRGK
jgi:fructose-specific phosphotransferase system component IIB